ncbi:hypothetical protein FOG51_03868 [Hanseniaspora uvarum]|nr:hypothetical protein FOG51_03868 [Hanseniaspora uvarum]
MKKFLNIIIAFVFLKTGNAEGEENFDDKIGCKIHDKMSLVSGLTGSVYYYPWLSYDINSDSGVQNQELYLTNDYLSGGYAGNGTIITENHTVYTEAGVIANDVTATELNFNFNNDCGSGNFCAGEVWSNLDYFTNSDGTFVRVPFTQFAFHLNGYLVPNITGNYTLNLNYIDDLAIMNIGSNGFNSPNCCDNYSPDGNVSGNNTIQSIWTPNGPSGINQIVLQLVAGVAYPIEFFYVNRGNLGAIQFEYIDPNGDVHQNFGGFVYQLSSDSVCSYINKRVITKEWDQPTTSTSFLNFTGFVTKTNNYLPGHTITYTGTIIKEDEVVYVPIPTVTTYWTGLDTSTSTSYLTTTDTDGSSITSSVIYIRTPEQTTTQLWTGTYTSTTTSDVVSTGTDGKETTSPIVVVETPESTITTYWTGNGTVTTTSDVVSTGTDGKETTSPIVVVETPGSTITTPWTGTFTSTTTSDAIITGTDGKVTTSTCCIH